MALLSLTFEFLQNRPTSWENSGLIRLRSSNYAATGRLLSIWKTTMFHTGGAGFGSLALLVSRSHGEA